MAIQTEVDFRKIDEHIKKKSNKKNGLEVKVCAETKRFKQFQKSQLVWFQEKK